MGGWVMGGTHRTLGDRVPQAGLSNNAKGGTHRDSDISLPSVHGHKHDERGITATSTFFGPATFVTHYGERPMSITWRLHHPMPAELFEEMKVAAG